MDKEIDFSKTSLSFIDAVSLSDSSILKARRSAFKLISESSLSEIRALLYHVFVNIEKMDVIALENAAWLFKEHDRVVYESAIKSSVESVSDKSSRIKIYDIFYKYLSREARFDEIFSIANSDPVVFEYFLDKGYLFRAYVLSRSDYPRFFPSFKPSSLPSFFYFIPEMKKDQMYDDFKITLMHLQLCFLDESYSCHRNVDEFFEKLNNVEETVLQDVVRGEDDFLDSLFRMREAKNIAIVLKGKTLKDKEMGYLIDSHDLVIRANSLDHQNGEVYGYKSDILYYSKHLRQKVRKVFEDESDKLVQTFSVCSDGVREKTIEIQRLLHALTYRSPTTGLILIILSLIFCKGHVTVFGFDSYSLSKGDFLRYGNDGRNNALKVRNEAASPHEVDYELWYVRSFLKDFLFHNKLLIV